MVRIGIGPPALDKSDEPVVPRKYTHSIEFNIGFVLQVRRQRQLRLRPIVKVRTLDIKHAPHAGVLAEHSHLPHIADEFAVHAATHHRIAVAHLKTWPWDSLEAEPVATFVDK